MGDRSLSNSMTVIGLVNGMIGGIILVMPILALKTGYYLIGPIAIISGFFSYFSSLLCLRHLRNFKDLDEAVLYHFDNKKGYKIFYDINIMVSLTVLLILYFGLICEQWVGMTEKSHLIPILNAFALFPIVYVMKKYHFGASLLAYGILSIIGFCIFLLWMLASAPEGQKQVPKGDPLFIDLAAALAQGFAIQTFFIPILKQNKNRHLYSKILFITYLIGTVVYTYIGYTGAYSIVNRIAPVRDPGTVEEYFGDKEWQVMVLQMLYLVHLYSAFPQFLLVAKKRFFSIFQWPESEDVSFKEVIYVGATIFISLIIRLTQIKASVLIQLNGSIVSFFFIYLIPIGLHLKCVYFTKKDERQLGTDAQLQQKKSKETPEILVKQKQSQKQIDTYNMENKTDIREEETSYSAYAHSCDVHFKSKAHEYCQLFLIGLMLISGLITMIYTIMTIAEGQQS